jgi:2'-5' RNA ligase
LDKPFRIFAAIELCAAIRARIQHHMDQLRTAVPEFQPSWTRVENIHLTVKFFGNVQQDRIALIENAASRAVKNFSEFKIFIGGTGAFPKPNHPRVLWIGVTDESKALTDLHDRFENECANEGFEKEGRAFRPHLTIARIKKPEGSRRAAEVNQQLGFAPLPLSVSELVVFRSELSNKGSKYTALSRHKLNRS